MANTGRRGPARPYGAMMCTHRPHSGGSLSRAGPEPGSDSGSATGSATRDGEGRFAASDSWWRAACAPWSEDQGGTWADQVLEMCLAGYQEPREKVVLDV